MVATRRGTPRFAEATDLFEPPPPETQVGAIGVEGHRLRLRERFLSAGPEALADHEMLDPGAVSSNLAVDVNEINQLTDNHLASGPLWVTSLITGGGSDASP